MKKIKLVTAILLALALLAAVLLAARFMLDMMSGLRQAGTEIVASPQGEAGSPRGEPEQPPVSLSDMAYAASEPQEPEFGFTPAPTEELVTVPVLETAEQLAAEALSGDSAPEGQID